MTTGFERWRGKISLVTGASSGIGAAIAIALGAGGLKVALAGRNRRRLAAVARQVARAGGETLLIPCDQTRMPANARMFRAVQRHWGNVDVLINAAGMRGGNAMLATEWTEIQAAIDLNVSAALWCMRTAAAQMRRKREGAIVNISSMVGHRVLPGVPAVYAATKHALRVLTDGLRAEIAQRGWPIKVALVSPGLTDTPWHRKRGGIRARGRNYPHAPLRTEDVAECVRYILAAPPTVQVSDVLLRSSAQPY